MHLVRIILKGCCVLEKHPSIEVAMVAEVVAAAGSLTLDCVCYYRKVFGRFGHSWLYEPWPPSSSSHCLLSTATTILQKFT
ncbi:hypothetical protein KP509_33G017700 [Ceratopteris richardii]|uniref:Uncharacterized protein n=1 Tax=Ceratopteris richardii TaxID=49495 RepID=A0A8T2QP00_CERRI|nr:hypothetical protein KP509_33G017700 [Ceratopteris richardii]